MHVDMVSARCGMQDAGYRVKGKANETHQHLLRVFAQCDLLNFHYTYDIWKEVDPLLVCLGFAVHLL